MTNRSSTGEAAGSGASISWSFVAHWLLSLAIPALLLTIVRIAIFSFSQSDAVYMTALLLPVAAWALVAYFQFRLIRPHLRRSQLWLIATFIGGNLGGFAGGLSHLKTTSMLERYANEKVLISDYNSVIHSDWIFAVAPTASVVAGVLVAAAILGLLQALCLVVPLSRRLLWLFASAASGIAAGAVGYWAFMGYIWAMIEIYPMAVIHPDIVPQLITMAVGMLCGVSLYGLLTGFTMRWLLTNQVGHQAQALGAQFD
jgi:hypothetical protein